MLSSYQPFVDRMIHRYEGGYGWNAKDPGGPTNFGITCFDLAENRHQRMTSMSAWQEPVKDMTLAEAEAIYKAKYATAIDYDELPLGIDCVMMDYGVNSGDARPIAVARAICSLRASSGRMDAELLAALQHADPKAFIEAMCDERLRFMHAIRGGSAWAEFGHGWGSRVADLRVYSQHVAQNAAHVAPDAPDLTRVVTPKATNVGNTAPKTTAGGAVATGASMHAAGFHWLPTAVAVAAIVAGGIGYEIWSENRANAANALVHI